MSRFVDCPSCLDFKTNHFEKWLEIICPTCGGFGKLIMKSYKPRTREERKLILDRAVKAMEERLKTIRK